jgi:hypothetical protein
MLGNKFTMVFNYHGVLAANPVGYFKLDKPATLTHVSFSCSTATAATIDLGDSGDPNGIIDDGAIGQSNAPAEFGPAEFNGALCDAVNPYHFPSDDRICTFTITHASAGDVCLVLTFYEG